MALRRLNAGGTLVLDSQGLSLYAKQDRTVLALVESAMIEGALRVISVATLVEARNATIKPARWKWVLSRFDVQPLSVDWATEAAELLIRTGLNGHTCAIDAMVAVTALHQPGPVVMLTSDIDDMAKLCGDQVTLVAV